MFMNLFLGSKKNKAEDNQLTQIFSICEFFKELMQKALMMFLKKFLKKIVKLLEGKLINS